MPDPPAACSPLASARYSRSTLTLPRTLALGLAVALGAVGCTSLLGDFSTGSPPPGDGGPADASTGVDAAEAQAAPEAGALDSRVPAPDASEGGADCATSSTCPLGAPCTSGFQCASSYCTGQTCQPPPCRLTASCALGASCAADGECASTHCLDGVCCGSSACPACVNCGPTGACDQPVKSAVDPTPTACSGASICNASGQCVPTWATVGTQAVSGPYETNMVGAAGSDIFVGNPSNGGVAQYVYRFSTTASAWTALPVSADVCACGYEGVFAASSAGLSYTANNSDLFDGTSWVSLPYPAANQTGEPSTASLGSVVFRIGGRTSSQNATTIVESYDMSAGTAGTWASYAAAPVSLYDGCAGADPATSTLYVFGSAGTPTYSFNVPTNTWTTLPAAANAKTPCSLLTAYKHGGALFFASGSNLATFDLTSQTWSQGDALPTTVDAGQSVVVTTAAGDLYVVGFTSATGTLSVLKWWR